MEEEEEGNIIEEREEFTVPSINGGCGLQTLRKAHFLKPVTNQINQPFPDISSFCLPLNPNYMQQIVKRVKFHGTLGPLKSWKSWVDDLQQTHQETWKKVGIFDAIRCSTYHIIRDNELIIELAERWCPETNTFIFPWGECSVTLEDVMILGGFSVLGTSARSHIRIVEDGEIYKKLSVVWRNLKKNSNSCVTQNVWMNYFMGRGGELEHVALVVLWLSRYVFSTDAYCKISFKVFSIAISLTTGTRIAPAPAVLASIYSDLRLLNEKIVTYKCDGQDDGSKLVVWAPFQLVQIWVWERFSKLGLKAKTLTHGEPRGARWHEIRMSKSGTLRLKIESSSSSSSSDGNGFLWRPYALHLKNWEFPKFYCDQEMWVLVTSEVDDEQYWSFAKCLRTSVLVGVDCVEQYLPQRVAMQFALDQDIPSSLPRSCTIAWNSYDKPVDGLKMYLAPLWYEGCVTFQYSEWWRGSTTKLKNVVLDVGNHEGNNYNENCIAEEEREVSGSSMNMGMGRKSHIQNEIHMSYSFPECNEEMGSEFVESCSDRLVDHVGLVNVMNPLVGVKEDKGQEQNKEKEVYMTLDEGTQAHDEDTGLLNRAEPLMGSQVGVGQDDEREDAKSKQVNSSNDNLVIICDEEEHNPCDASEALDLAFDSRITSLENKVSVLQAAKLKSKAT